MNTPTQSPAVATHTPTITASIGSTGASFHYNNVASHPLSFRIEYRSPELSEEGQQLATFIVRACNSHAQLVAALRTAATALGYIALSGDRGATAAVNALEAVNATLARLDSKA